MDFKIPETGEELREFLADQKKVGAVSSATAVNDGTAKKFLDAHAAIRNKKDAELQAQQREQMQIVLAEFLRDPGAQAGPPVGLPASGRPFAGPPGNGPGSVVRRQSLYNKSAHGSPLNGMFDTMGDFFRAVTQEGAGRQYRDAVDLNARLDKVKAIQNAFGTDVPSDGGFLVPEEFLSDLLMLALESAVIRPRATVIPMGSQTLALPAVDDTSHATTIFGGIQTYWVDESSAPTETSAKFAQVKLDAKKRSEEHTSELQSPDHLVCRLLLEKKKTTTDFRVSRMRRAHFPLP